MRSMCSMRWVLSCVIWYSKPLFSKLQAHVLISIWATRGTSSPFVLRLSIMPLTLQYLRIPSVCTTKRVIVLHVCACSVTTYCSIFGFDHEGFLVICVHSHVSPLYSLHIHLYSFVSLQTYAALFDTVYLLVIAFGF
jgi:hypothetical protein